MTAASRRKRNEGQKPKIAFKTEEKATENIRLKLSLLTRAGKPVAHSLPLADAEAMYPIEALRDFLPRSIRQFNMWSSKVLPPELAANVPPFGANSAKTLKRSGLELDVAESIKALADVKRHEETKENAKERSVSRLRRELALSNRLRGICERELLSVKIQRDQLKMSLEALANKYRSLEAEAAKHGMKLARNRGSSLDGVVIPIRPAGDS